MSDKHGKAGYDHKREQVERIERREAVDAISKYEQTQPAVHDLLAKGEDLREQYKLKFALLTGQLAKAQADAEKWEREARGLRVTVEMLSADGIKRMGELEELQARYRWRPIAYIHEDYGQCVVIRIDDPGSMAVMSNLDEHFDPADWTHFAQAPSLTNEEAAALAAPLRPKEETTPNPRCAERHESLPYSSDHLWQADIHGVPSGPCLKCGEDHTEYSKRVQNEIARLLPNWVPPKE